MQTLCPDILTHIRYPVKEVNGNFLMASDTPCLWSDLTFHTKECKLSLAHLLTEYRVTVRQTSNCHPLFFFIIIYGNVSCFWVALYSSPYELEAMKIVFVLNAKIIHSFSGLRHQLYVISGLALGTSLKIRKWRFVGRSSHKTFGCNCVLCLPAKFEFC